MPHFFFICKWCYFQFSKTENTALYEENEKKSMFGRYMYIV